MEYIKHSIVMVLLLFFFGCSQTENNMDMDIDNNIIENRQLSNQTDSVLVISGSLTETDAISFGRTYNFHIKNLTQGSLREKSIRILVLAGDEYEPSFSVHSSKDDVEITFMKEEENVPYQLMPLTGFVDKNMTSWKITRVRTKQEMMTLNITAKEGLQLGYGTVFNCNIKTSEENFKQDSILLMLIHDEYIRYLRAHTASAKITCKKIKENVSEKYLPINGFVDNSRNGWEIISIK